VRPLALLLSLALLQSPALPPTRDQLLSVFGSYFESLRVQSGIPGLAAAIVGDTDLIWEQAFGRQNLGNLTATKTDTPFHFDGLTQVVTATLVLRCIEEGRVQLDTPVRAFTPSSPDADATIAQILTHTFGPPNNLVFSYKPARLDALRFVTSPCAGMTFRRAFASQLERVAMFDSVPGPDAAQPSSPADLTTPAEIDRYDGVLARLATPYAVSPQGLASPSQYPATTLGAAGGLISTVRDFAKFDLALRQGILLRGETLATAWRAPVGANGAPLPHGMGWFVQSYNGEPVVWQFGAGANASSSLVITLPARNITLILAANSDGLAKPDSLAAGDITVSPFARVFLGLVIK